MKKSKQFGSRLGASVVMMGFIFGLCVFLGSLDYSLFWDAIVSVNTVATSSLDKSWLLGIIHFILVWAGFTVYWILVFGFVFFVSLILFIFLILMTQEVAISPSKPLYFLLPVSFLFVGYCCWQLLSLYYSESSFSSVFDMLKACVTLGVASTFFFIILSAIVIICNIVIASLLNFILRTKVMFAALALAFFAGSAYLLLTDHKQATSYLPYWSAKKQKDYDCEPFFQWRYREKPDEWQFSKIEGAEHMKWRESCIWHDRANKVSFSHDEYCQKDGTLSRGYRNDYC